MENNGYQFPSSATCSLQAMLDIANHGTIIEEGPRICPLCNSIMRLFYIDYTAKILMCENLRCEYPFGDDYVIYSSDDDGAFMPEPEVSNTDQTDTQANQAAGQTSKFGSTLETGSEVSTTEWSEINRLNQAYDSDDSLTSSKILARRPTPHKEKLAKKQENEEKIKENVEKIKELNNVLFNSNEDMGTIRNEKWIRNLSTMQSSSGKRLVKDQELKKLKRSQQEAAPVRELKIDIEAKKDAMSSIKIEIGNLQCDKKT